MNDEARGRQKAMYSLYAALVVALMVAGSWWMLRAGAAAPAGMQRRISDQALDWQCPNGHRFEAQGRTHRIRCPECGRKADISVSYVCPEHGERPALIRVVRTAEGGERLSEVSFRLGVWRRVHRSVRCPECGRSMRPPAVNPFASDAVR